MVRPDRASLASSAPLDELLTLYLRQLKRPLAAQGVPLNDADIHDIVRGIVSRTPPNAQAEAVRAALVALVTESEGVLAQWNLSFEQALDTGMDAIPGWESTAEFLDIANEKSNAEIRIAAGAVLVSALGDLRYAPHLLALAARKDDDVDNAVARRVLQFLSGTDAKVPNWLDQAREWLQAQ
jgi:hypothetical protein